MACKIELFRWIRTHLFALVALIASVIPLLAEAKPTIGFFANSSAGRKIANLTISSLNNTGYKFISPQKLAGFLEKENYGRFTPERKYLAKIAEKVDADIIAFLTEYSKGGVSGIKIYDTKHGFLLADSVLNGKSENTQALEAVRLIRFASDKLKKENNLKYLTIREVSEISGTMEAGVVARNTAMILELLLLNTSQFALLERNSPEMPGKAETEEYSCFTSPKNLYQLDLTFKRTGGKNKLSVEVYIGKENGRGLGKSFIKADIASSRDIAVKIFQVVANKFKLKEQGVPKLDFNGEAARFYREYLSYRRFYRLENAESCLSIACALNGKEKYLNALSGLLAESAERLLRRIEYRFRSVKEAKDRHGIRKFSSLRWEDEVNKRNEPDLVLVVDKIARSLYYCGKALEVGNAEKLNSKIRHFFAFMHGMKYFARLPAKYRMRLTTFSKDFTAIQKKAAPVSAIADDGNTGSLKTFNDVNKYYYRLNSKAVSIQKINYLQDIKKLHGSYFSYINSAESLAAKTPANKKRYLDCLQFEIRYCPGSNQFTDKEKSQLIAVNRPVYKKLEKSSLPQFKVYGIFYSFYVDNFQRTIRGLSKSKIDSLARELWRAMPPPGSRAGQITMCYRHIVRAMNDNLYSLRKIDADSWERLCKLLTLLMIKRKEFNGYIGWYYARAIENPKLKMAVVQKLLKIMDDDSYLKSDANSYIKGNLRNIQKECQEKLGIRDHASVTADEQKKLVYEYKETSKNQKTHSRDGSIVGSALHGNNLYYLLYPCELYCYNLDSGKSRKITSGRDISVYYNFNKGIRFFANEDYFLTVGYRKIILLRASRRRQLVINDIPLKYPLAATIYKNRIYAVTVKMSRVGRTVPLDTNIVSWNIKGKDQRIHLSTLNEEANSELERNPFSVLFIWPDEKNNRLLFAVHSRDAKLDGIWQLNPDKNEVKKIHGIPLGYIRNVFVWGKKIYISSYYWDCAFNPENDKLKLVFGRKKEAEQLKLTPKHWLKAGAGKYGPHFIWNGWLFWGNKPEREKLDNPGTPELINSKSRSKLKIHKTDDDKHLIIDNGQRIWHFSKK